MTIDLDAAIRRRKPDKRLVRLEQRPDRALTSIDDLPATGVLPLVVDTNVYINNAAGRLSPAVETALERAVLFHCSVCVAEIAAGIANANPSHKGWKNTRAIYGEVLGTIPATRLLTPDDQIWCDAGLISGMLTRLQGFQTHQRKEVLNDALILLTAAKAGLAVLTSDRDHYDLLQQLCPETRFVFY